VLTTGTASIVIFCGSTGRIASTTTATILRWGRIRFTVFRESAPCRFLIRGRVYPARLQVSDEQAHQTEPAS